MGIIASQIDEVTEEVGVRDFRRVQWAREEVAKSSRLRGAGERLERALRASAPAVDYPRIPRTNRDKRSPQRVRYVLPPTAYGESLAKVRARCEAKILERKTAAVRAVVLPAYDVCGYRVSCSSWAGGSHKVTVRIGDVMASGSSLRVWSSNRKWSGNDSAHTLQVRADYDTRVPPYLRVISGLLTLDVGEEVKAGIFAAVWAEQGRGVSLNTRHGFIARRSDGTFVHADTVRGATRAQAGTIKRTSTPLPSDAKGLLGRARLTGDEIVDRMMANMAGHCDAGIRDWTARHGLTDRTEITAGELASLACASGDRVADVYAVLLAVKRAARKVA